MMFSVANAEVKENEQKVRILLRNKLNHPLINRILNFLKILDFYEISNQLSRFPCGGEVGQNGPMWKE